MSETKKIKNTLNHSNKSNSAITEQTAESQS